VALCGGTLDDRRGWMLDAVDVHTGWVVLRGLPKRGEASVCGQMDDLRAGPPFPFRGIDSDNGGGWCPDPESRKGMSRSCFPAFQIQYQVAGRTHRAPEFRPMDFSWSSDERGPYGLACGSRKKSHQHVFPR
jgi:hypothetical protein